MKVLHKAPDETNGMYWWLPKCDLEHVSNPRRWSLMSFGPHHCQGRVGLFIGPVEMPGAWALAAEEALKTGQDVEIVE